MLLGNLPDWLNWIEHVTCNHEILGSNPRLGFEKGYGHLTANKLKEKKMTANKLVECVGSHSCLISN